MRIRPIVAWYDLWVGAFYDRAKRRLYIFPFPCFGFYVERASLATMEDEPATAKHSIKAAANIAMCHAEEAARMLVTAKKSGNLIASTHFLAAASTAISIANAIRAKGDDHG